MAVSIKCPACGAVLKSATALPPGKKLKCPKCAGLFVPATDAVQAKPSAPTVQNMPAAPQQTRKKTMLAPVQEVAPVHEPPSIPELEMTDAPPRSKRGGRDEDDDRPRKKRRRDENDDGPRRRRPDDEDDDERPRRGGRAKKKGGHGLLIGLIAGGGLLMVAAAVLVIVLFVGGGGGNPLVGRWEGTLESLDFRADGTLTHQVGPLRLEKTYRVIDARTVEVEMKNPLVDLKGVGPGIKIDVKSQAQFAIQDNQLTLTVRGVSMKYTKK